MLSVFYILYYVICVLYSVFFPMQSVSNRHPPPSFCCRLTCSVIYSLMYFVLMNRVFCLVFSNALFFMPCPVKLSSFPYSALRICIQPPFFHHCRLTYSVLLCHALQCSVRSLPYFLFICFLFCNLFSLFGFQPNPIPPLCYYCTLTCTVLCCCEFYNALLSVLYIL